MGIRRIVLGSAVVSALSAPLLLAGNTGAAADQWDCTFHLLSQGYSGKIVDIGCASGSEGDAVVCVGSLRIAGVPQALAEEACRRAAIP